MTGDLLSTAVCRLEHACMCCHEAQKSVSGEERAAEGTDTTVVHLLLSPQPSGGQNPVANDNLTIDAVWRAFRKCYTKKYPANFQKDSYSINLWYLNIRRGRHSYYYVKGNVPHLTTLDRVD